jgi:hypothetical protein
MFLSKCNVKEYTSCSYWVQKASHYASVFSKIPSTNNYFLNEIIQDVPKIMVGFHCRISESVFDDEKQNVYGFITRLSNFHFVRGLEL